MGGQLSQAGQGQVAKRVGRGQSGNLGQVAQAQHADQAEAEADEQQQAHGRRHVPATAGGDDHEAPYGQPQHDAGRLGQRLVRVGRHEDAGGQGQDERQQGEVERRGRQGGAVEGQGDEPDQGQGQQCPERGRRQQVGEQQPRRGQEQGDPLQDYQRTDGAPHATLILRSLGQCGHVAPPWERRGPGLVRAFAAHDDPGRL